MVYFKYLLIMGNKPARIFKKSYAKFKTFLPPPRPRRKKCAAKRNIFDDEGDPYRAR